MFGLTSSHRYFLYRHPTDMRKSFNGLCGLVESQLERNPLSGEVYIFINRRRDMVKMLRWEQGGFVLYYKRLESGTFELPAYNNDRESYQMNWSDLVMMVEGIAWQKAQKRKRFRLSKTG